jgi:hypothetical protein
MAEFSKDYCEKYMPDMVYDFDINDILKELDNGYFKPIICEGYGYIAIGKSEDGKPIVAIRESIESIKWLDYNIFTENFKNNI